MASLALVSGEEVPACPLQSAYGYLPGPCKGPAPVLRLLAGGRCSTWQWFVSGVPGVCQVSANASPIPLCLVYAQAKNRCASRKHVLYYPFVLHATIKLPTRFVSSVDKQMNPRLARAVPMYVADIQGPPANQPFHDPTTRKYFNLLFLAAQPALQVRSRPARYDVESSIPPRP